MAYELRKKMPSTPAADRAAKEDAAMLDEHLDPSRLPADLEKLRCTLVSDLGTTLSTLIKEALDTALGPISASLENIRKTTDSHGQRIQDLERHLSEYSDRIVELEECTKTLRADNVRLLAKTEDLENRSRRSNMRIIGIPEKLEGGDPVAFMSAFFAEVLGADYFPDGAPIIDRAHRLGSTPASERSRPRVFIVRFHYYRDKERVAGRRGDQLYFRGHKVFIFQDHSASTAQRRASFNAVKAQLYEKKVKFGIRMPAARLWIQHDGSRHFFDSPEEAQTFYNQHFA